MNALSDQPSLSYQTKIYTIIKVYCFNCYNENSLLFQLKEPVQIDYKKACSVMEKA